MKIKDSNIFPMPGNKHLIHLATVQDGNHEYVAMLRLDTQQVYVEEVVLETVDFSKDVFANLKFIKDDKLAAELANFLNEKGVLDMKRIQEQLLGGAK